jgi:hypothetical protein
VFYSALVKLRNHAVLGGKNDFVSLFFSGVFFGGKNDFVSAKETTDCVNSPKNCLSEFVLIKILESLSSTSDTNADIDVFTSVLILVPGILKR